MAFVAVIMGLGLFFCIPFGVEVGLRPVVSSFSVHRLQALGAHA